MENYQPPPDSLPDYQSTGDPFPSPPHLSRLSERQPPRDLEQVNAQASTRRELFLQERKDRLMQRRQEHSLVLARGRHDGPAKLEALRESLSAAQAARNAIYARIAANGSKELAKVQLVVSQNKEKLRLERETKRIALEIKLAEAEKRREAVLRHRVQGRRSASPRLCVRQDSQVTPPLSPMQAAAQIQRWWRAHLTRTRVRKFLSQRLNYETAGDIPFDVFADIIKGQEVIACSGKLLETLGILNENATKNSRNAICRVFLATFMIVGHPKDILMRQGPLEASLIVQAKAFAVMFTHWLRRSADGHLCCHEPLAALWRKFHTVFQSWKQDDSSNLVEVMIAQYCELDLIYQIVRLDSDPIVAAEYHTAIKDNQLLLLSRIKRIAGEETRKMIRTAVLRARRKRLPKQAKPPVANEPSAIEEANSPLTDAIQFFSLGQRQTRLSNRQLIHELALCPGYQISKPVLSATDAAAEETMKRNFFACLQTEMRAARSASWIPIIVQECKMRLLRLVMPGSPTFKAITATFDLPAVESECRENCYDYSAFIKVVIRMMAALCSPARDGLVARIHEIRGVDDIDHFAKSVDAIFEVLDVLLLDSANFHLSVSAQQLIPQAIPYEQRMFTEEMQNGGTILQTTSEWILAASQEMQQHAATTRPNVMGVFQHAFVKVCTMYIAMPETLHLDHDRISDARTQTECIVTVAAHLMAARNLLRSKSHALNPSVWLSIKDRITILVRDKADAPSIAAEMNHLLDCDHFGTEGDRVLRHLTLLNLINKSASSDPVRQLLRTRLQELMREAIDGREVAASRIAGCGMSDVSGEVSLLLERVRKLASLNFACYATWYEAILA